MRPLRIGMVAACPFPTTQGTQVAIADMIRALVTRGHEVHLVTYGHGEDLPPCGATMHRARSLPGYSRMRSGPDWCKPVLNALLLAPLLRLVRSGRVDLLHAHNYEAPVPSYFARAITGIPVLYQAHNLMADELHLYFEKGRRQSLAKLTARVLDASIPRLADRCVVMSEEAIPALASLGVKQENIDLILPAVCWNQFAQIRSNPGRVVSRPTVIYTGNPDVYQDLDVLLRAMQLVVEQLPSARLLVVTGSQPRELLEEARRLGINESNLSVLVTREWLRVQEEMAGAQVAALPRGRCRGFPVKLLNYQAMGLPVVACAGSAKNIEHGRSGLVVADGDDRAFAAALLRLLNSPADRDRMGRAGRTSVREEHCWKSRVIQLEQTYARVIGLESERGLL